jgi:DNA (cytosine-5)-methyltransferase 1
MRHMPWLKNRDYPELIAPVREMLNASGKPYIIENVMGAVTKRELEGGWLCGEMFGLPFYRHRAFETNWFWLQPGHPKHRNTILAGGMFGGRLRQITYTRPDGSKSTLSRTAGSHRTVTQIQQTADGMAIDWMTRAELSQAIPPAYSEFLGRQLILYAQTRD